MDSFWEGFEKEAGKAKMFRNITKNIKVVGTRAGSGPHEDRAILRLAMQQRSIKGLGNLADKLMGPGAKKRLREQLYSDWGGQVMGTFAPGKKGKRLYVSRDVFRPGAKDQLGLSPRGVVNHEAFHAFAPAGLGKSEILAHAYGGLKNTKGKHDYGKAMQQVGHAFKNRPLRASLEAGLAGGTGLGAYKGGKALKNKYDDLKGG